MRRSAPSSLGRSEMWIQQQNKNYFLYYCNKCFRSSRLHVYVLLKSSCDVTFGSRFFSETASMSDFLRRKMHLYIFKQGEMLT